MLIRIDYGLAMRKSRIQLHMDKLNPSSLCLMISLEGTMVLNAKMWSIN